MAERIIGIDLGTSISSAAIIQGGKPTIIPAAEGQTAHGKAFPSVVAFPKDGSAMLVGTPAVNQAASNPENTIINVKRKMGTEHVYKILGKEYKPQQISAFILQKIKKDTEAFTGDKITNAVITVPAYFDEKARQATKDAGTIAGFEVVRIINESTAACLAFGFDRLDLGVVVQDMKILVVDFGGGTVDVTIMAMGDAGFDGQIFEVMSTAGDTRLGGIDMDQAIVDYVKEEFRKKEGVDLSSDKKAMERLREGCEKAKIELSGVMKTVIKLPYIHEKTALEVKLTRAKLKSLVKPIVARCKFPIDMALYDAKLSTSDITKIVLTGASTFTPFVKKFLEDTVGKKLESGIDPMEAVAFGAAIQAGIMAGDVESDIVLLDVNPLTLGIETSGGVREPIIQRNRTLPAVEERIFTTAADNQTTITINVVQGERPMVADNVSLGSFNFTNIPPAPRGVPQISVKFHIDTNGIINITGKDLRTGKDTKITIESSTKLSDEEVEKLMQDAEKRAEEDKKKKESVDIKNEAEHFIYTTEKLVKQYLKDKISQEQGIKVTDAVKEVLEVLSQDSEQIKTKLDALKAIVNEITTGGVGKEAIENLFAVYEKAKRQKINAEAEYEKEIEREKRKEEQREREKRKEEQSKQREREEEQREREEEQRKQKKSEKPIYYWSNFRESDYYVPQEWHGDKPSKDRTSDVEFDAIVQDYLWNPNEGYGRWVTNLFIGEFRERRKAQPDFTNIKEETEKREAEKRKAEAKKREAEKKEDAKRKTEAKKRRKERKLTEKDLKGKYPEFDYYKLLLVPNYAGIREINAAFKQLMLVYHDDKWYNATNQEKKLALKIAKKLNEAHDVLKNRDSREKYDEEHGF